jgi:hypothetical protein
MQGENQTGVNGINPYQREHHPIVVAARQR